MRAAWEQVARAISQGSVTVTDLAIIPLGPDVALTVGVEHGVGTIGGEDVRFDARATNVYRREDGAWKVVAHHADLAPAMRAAIARLMASKQ